jgi:hypothetical protein
VTSLSTGKMMWIDRIQHKFYNTIMKMKTEKRKVSSSICGKTPRLMHDYAQSRIFKVLCMAIRCAKSFVIQRTHR